ncbi:shikimate dehydrogenase [Brooklawnia cerclae]|uniref:Shikimate dehydrogenase n=1 Tax=Brooklawnia cerclae TaxID=349934 RepID=A0ABX0SP48_9ACTN|nr:shikimate dehydrogenase [Brooklawnia cerclae]NIH58536.1 shikimate dehydrogenase [Brooklawnia cerclae]
MVRRCAVIGSPIAHSLSPLLHRTAYAELGIADEYQYDAFEVTPDTLDEFVAGLGSEWVGLSVTAPDKQALLCHGVADPLAEALRSANTLILGRDGEPNRVYNTDIVGFGAALARQGVRTARTAVLVGNGATARTALLGLARLGVDDAVVLARDESRARASLDPIAGPAGVRLRVQPFGSAPELPEEWNGHADLLVSTVPVEVPDNLASALVQKVSAVFEATYNHYPTAIDRAAARAGLVSVDGLDFLVGQALDQIRLMTGRQADPGPLLAACRAEIARRQPSA